MRSEIRDAEYAVIPYLARWPLAAPLLLLAVTSLVGCGLESADDARSFLIFDRHADSGDYRLTESTIETLDEVGRVDGEIAKFHAGGNIVTGVATGEPETAEEFRNSLKIEGAKPPRVDYSIADDGVVVPADFHSTIMLTLYHHLEVARGYFVGLGVEASRIGKVPVYYYPRLELFIPISLLTDNAAYAFTLDAFMIPPTLLVREVPLAANRGVIVHEYSHRVFNRLVHDGKRVPEYLLEPWSDPATNRMRSLDEGIADIFAALQTGDPNFIGSSLSEERFGIDRDLTKERHYTTELEETIETSAMAQYNPYKLGSVIASTLWALRDSLSDEQLGRAIRRALESFASVEPPFTVAPFFNALHEELPDGVQSAACDIFEQRLDAIRQELTCR